MIKIEPLDLAMSGDVELRSLFPNEYRLLS